MTKEYDEIVCVIDRSGSMESVKNEAISGFNAFLKEQQDDPREANLTLVQFDTEYEMVHENVPIRDVPQMTSETFQPRGMTALLDAIGKTIDDVGTRLLNILPENRPQKVIMVVLTDGLENSSYKYHSEKILQMITHQEEKYGWEFLYLGANQDAFTVGGQMGFKKADIQNFEATPQGMRTVYASASLSVRSKRSGSPVDSVKSST